MPWTTRQSFYIDNNINFIGSSTDTRCATPPPQHSGARRLGGSRTRGLVDSGAERSSGHHVDSVLYIDNGRVIDSVLYTDDGRGVIDSILYIDGSRSNDFRPLQRLRPRHQLRLQHQHRTHEGLQIAKSLCHEPNFLFYF